MLLFKHTATPVYVSQTSIQYTELGTYKHLSIPVDERNTQCPIKESYHKTPTLQ